MMKKNPQHQQEGKPQTQDKSQGAAIYVKDAIIIIRGFNLCGTHRFFPHALKYALASCTTFKSILS
jgi:hypothetical protein